MSEKLEENIRQIQSLKIIFVLVVCSIFTACANPSIINVKSQQLKPISHSVIYVPRFEGNPDFVEESTDYFVSFLEANLGNKIIQGSVLRSEPTDIRSGGNLAPMKIALKQAKEKGAGLLILGKVTSHQTGNKLNGFSTIRVIAVDTGEKVANFHRPSGLLFANSTHQCVMAAVKRTAADFASAMK